LGLLHTRPASFGMMPFTLALCWALLLQATAEDVGAKISQWLHARRQELPFSLDPGVAVAVVSDYGARVDLLEGNGVQSLADKVPVSEHTLFEVGSVSKTLVALALGTLVDEGALGWDTSVADVLGSTFHFGDERYVQQHLSVRDLLSHRSGLAEGQGDFFGAVRPSSELPSRLGNLLASHDFRSVFAYSNTGWDLAGEVLRASSNSSSWCEALGTRILKPLGLHDTFCDRNGVSGAADARVAGVHKASPCDGLGPAATTFRQPAAEPPLLRSYNLTRTGAAGAFAWGAAEAAGSVLSSVSDLAKVMSLLLTATSDRAAAVPQVVTRKTLAEMLSGQMVVPASWAEQLGIPGSLRAGRAAAAGLGFDLAGQLPVEHVPVGMAGKPYAEKNGDTAMHKARLGLLPAEGIAVLLLSNLGGEVGDPLAALKFGMLALAAGASEEAADDFAEAVLNTTGYWESQFVPDATCTPCGTVLSSFGFCIAGNRSTPSVPVGDFVGSFGDRFYGDVLTLSRDKGGQTLRIRLGPIETTTLFGAQNMDFQLACGQLVSALKLPAWLVKPLERENQSECHLLELRVPTEVPAAGISDQRRTIAFPWGCGTVPMPDMMPVWLITVLGRTPQRWALLPTAGVLLQQASTVGLDIMSV